MEAGYRYYILAALEEKLSVSLSKWKLFLFLMLGVGAGGGGGPQAGTGVWPQIGRKRLLLPRIGARPPSSDRVCVWPPAAARLPAGQSGRRGGGMAARTGHTAPAYPSLTGCYLKISWSDKRYRYILFSKPLKRLSLKEWKTWNNTVKNKKTNSKPGSIMEPK
jgi:hypothetical protein